MKRRKKKSLESKVNELLILQLGMEAEMLNQAMKLEKRRRQPYIV